MPRNMSFSMTTEQYRNQTKTHTMRIGWEFAEVGDICNGVEKAQGLKKGEKVVYLGQHRITAVSRKPVNLVTPEIVIREGFPDWTVEQFIDFFCKGHKCAPETTVTWIGFEYL